jgi:hypothetical protein
MRIAECGMQGDAMTRRLSPYHVTSSGDERRGAAVGGVERSPEECEGRVSLGRASSDVGAGSAAGDGSGGRNHASVGRGRGQWQRQPAASASSGGERCRCPGFLSLTLISAPVSAPGSRHWPWAVPRTTTLTRHRDD